MKLELKHLAAYLPYRLKVKYDIEYGSEWELDIHNLNALTENDKLILRPLSDLFKGGYEFILDEFSMIGLEHFKFAFFSELKTLNAFDTINYTTALLLFENHFDIYGLIENNLAIDINTLDCE